MKRIPFILMSMETAKDFSRHFLGWGETLSKFFPSLDFELEQSGIDMEVREWLGLAFYGFILYFVILFSAFFTVGLTTGLALRTIIGISLLVATLSSLMILTYFSLIPKLKTKKKVRNLEQNLPFALRHVLIQIRSGVTLFSALVSVGWSNYGALSHEFRKAVNEINTGKSEIVAMETIARNNPSMFLRRIMWQMVNSLKSGSDIGKVVKNIVDNMTTEQLVAIKKYGSELNPLALFYMMLVVIFPTLGIVFLLILFSFVGTDMDIELVLLGILGFLVFVQIMFIGMIKNKRPRGI